MANLVKNGYFTTPTTNQYFAITSATNFIWNLVVANQGGSYIAKIPNVTIYGTTNPPTSSGINQFIAIEANNSGIQQTINFPFTGNYVLSFWVSKRAGVIDSQKVRFRLGSFFDVSYDVSPSAWTNINVPFLPTKSIQ